MLMRSIVHRAMPAEVIELLRHIGTSVKPDASRFDVQSLDRQ